MPICFPIHHEAVGFELRWKKTVHSEFLFFKLYEAKEKKNFVLPDFMNSDFVLINTASERWNQVILNRLVRDGTSLRNLKYSKSVEQMEVLTRNG